MRNVILFLGLLYISLGQVSAQCAKIDSLRRMLLILKAVDTNRINTSNFLAQELLKNKQEGAALFYAQYAQNLAQQIKYPKGIGDSYMILGDVYYRDPFKRDESCIESYEKARQVYANANLRADVAEALKKTGDFYYNLFYLKADYYNKSLEYYLQYLKIVEELADIPKTAKICVVIANVYSQLGEEKESQKYFLKAVELKTELEDGQLDDPHLFSKAEKFYKLQIEYQKLYNYILIGGLGFLLALVLSLIYLMIQKQRSHKVLEQQKKEIQEQRDAIENKNQELKRQNTEIEQQHDQLHQNNKDLQAAKDEIKTTNEQLTVMNQHLEEIVSERTQDLVFANEALVVANEELDTLIYRASHDFKGPVATLTGLSQVAKMELDTDHSAVDFFNKIEYTARKMDGMLEKLHQVSYIISKDFEKEFVNFEEIIQETQFALEEAIKTSNMDIQLQITPGTYCYSDKELLFCIFENLIENAIYFRTPDPQIAPCIKIHIQHEEEYTSIEFEDNGVGIPAKLFSKIFDMFFRGSEMSKGNGLGLYVTKKALDRLKGQVKIDSKIGEYTSFKFLLPAH